MGATYYPCGCMIVRSMFGEEREIIGFNVCSDHAVKYQEKMEDLSKLICEDQKSWLEKTKNNE